MQPDTFYHIYNRANGSENLFREEENFRFFLRKWAMYIQPIAETYAYCLMPNHFHFLIKTRLEEDVLAFVQQKRPSLQGFQTLGGITYANTLSRQYSHLFNCYTQAYNKRFDRRGSLFSPNFKRKEIDSENYLTTIIQYIHHNPIHHGFCNRYEDWPYSSYKVFINKGATRIDRNYVLNWFGGRDAFTHFHQLNIQLPDTSLHNLSAYLAISGK